MLRREQGWGLAASHGDIWRAERLYNNELLYVVTKRTYSMLSLTDLAAVTRILLPAIRNFLRQRSFVAAFWRTRWAWASRLVLLP